MQITTPAQHAGDKLTIKLAAHARAFGASELMLATMTGSYPPPHLELDKYGET